MMRVGCGVGVLAAWLAVSLAAQDANHQAPASQAPKVTYIANDGFLVEHAGARVLVDALFDTGFGSYLAPSPQVLDLMSGARDRFAGVDLVLVTHPHGDHLNPKVVIAHMRNDPRCRLIAHTQVVDLLRKEEGFDAIRDRIHEVTLAVGSREQVTLNGIVVDVLCLPHSPYLQDGRDVHQQTKNLAFAVELGGMRFLHVGDASIGNALDHLNTFPFDEKPVDLLFGCLGLSDTAQQLIARTIKPSRIVAMHVPPAALEEQAKAIRAVYPHAVVFRQSMEERSLPLAAGFHRLSGAYFGQTPPGATPEVFAPGIVSTDANEHMAPSFSPDGSEVFWWANRPPGPDNKEWAQLPMTMRRESGRWSAPHVTKFGPMAAFSPDGRRLYFATGKDIWYVEKQGREWGEPRCLNLVARFPELREAHMPRIASNGTLYFVAYLPGVRGDRGIYRAELIGGEYARPEALPRSINLAPFINWAPFIAPDESYLLFSSNRTGSLDTAGDLYVSHRLADGSWTDPVSLGEPVNTGRQEVFPGLSPDGRYLFFCRDVPGRENDVYWVSAATIPALRRVATTRETGRQGPLDSAPDLAVFRRSPRIVQIKVPGLGMFSTNIVVVATQKGLVVIDTWHAPFVFQQVARIAEKEFGRRDFAYVINSHEDVDHSSGNSFFEGATLVAQRQLLKSLGERQAGWRQWESWYRGRIQGAIRGAESLLPTLDPTTAEASALAADLQMTRRLDRAFEAGFAILPAAPKAVVAFDDTYSLALGDLTVECFATRFGHTPSDLFIHIPQEGFLFTGDVPLVRLPRNVDMPHWLALLERVTARTAGLRLILGGHLEEPITPADLGRIRDYYVALWDAVGLASRQGLTVEQMKSRYSLDNEMRRFRDLVSTPFLPGSEDELRAKHASNIETLANARRQTRQ